MLGFNIGEAICRQENASMHALKRKYNPVIAGAVTLVAAGTLASVAVATGFIATTQQLSLHL